ncbi:MAG: hypothetical protein QXF46_05880 [Thermofilaceae archaeon]
MPRSRGDYGSLFFTVLFVTLVAVNIFLYVEKVTRTGLWFHPGAFTYLRWAFLLSLSTVWDFAGFLAGGDPQRRKYLTIRTSFAILVALTLWAFIEGALVRSYGWVLLPDPPQIVFFHLAGALPLVFDAIPRAPSARLFTLQTVVLA